MTWRFVQPGWRQVAICLMSDDGMRAWIVQLEIVFKDREGMTVRLHQQHHELVSRWRWRL